MTFPMAISGFFFKAATMEVASSGNEGLILLFGRISNYEI